MTVPDDALAQMKRNRVQYDQLAALTESAARNGDVERVLLTATIAANSAWNAPVEFVSDPHLERLIVESVRGDADVTVDPTRDNGRVLHVLSEGYVTGGHTRLAYRWMQRDHRRADVALTNQHTPIPPKLIEAVQASQGRVYDLREASLKLTGRAAALRRLMDRADLVVLHIHPYDAVAIAAANLPGVRPPIIFEDHADHAFWLGLSGADAFMHHRTVGQQLSAQLRGIRPARMGLLPLPLDPPEHPADRNEVRRRLRLGPRDVLGLSVATAHKMTPVWGEAFDTLLAPALEANPHLVVMLVGPGPDATWNSALSRFPQRVFHLGVLSDLGPLYAAADIYLDSFPVSGATSILEAAALGLPVLSPPAYEGHLRIYQANSPGLEGSGDTTSSREDWLASLTRLVQRPQLRRELGHRAQRSVLGAHSGESWDIALEDLYVRARSAPPASLAEYPDRAVDTEFGLRLVSFMERSSHGSAGPAFCASSVADAIDQQLGCDIYVATSRDGDKALTVRIGPGWDDHPAWMIELAQLAGRFPRLSVSLPLSGDDDGTGERSAAHLIEILASGGLDIEACGDFSLDPTEPLRTPPMIADVPPFTAPGLDLIHRYLASSSWPDPGTPTAADGPAR